MVAPVAEPVSVRGDPLHTGFGAALALTEVGALHPAVIVVVPPIDSALEPE